MKRPVSRLVSQSLSRPARASGRQYQFGLPIGVRSLDSRFRGNDSKRPKAKAHDYWIPALLTFLMPSFPKSVNRESSLTCAAGLPNLVPMLQRGNAYPCAPAQGIQPHHPCGSPTGEYLLDSRFRGKDGKRPKAKAHDYWIPVPLTFLMPSFPKSVNRESSLACAAGQPNLVPMPQRGNAYPCAPARASGQQQQFGSPTGAGSLDSRFRGNDRGGGNDSKKQNGGGR